MSSTSGNGKPPRSPRTPSHAPPERPPREPAPRGAGESPPSGEDAPDGLLGPQAKPSLSVVTNDGHAPDGKFVAGNGVGHRFEKGNRFGKGNPTARKMHELRMQFLDAVHPDTIPALARGLQVKALKEGDEFAIQTLLSYCLGKPTGAIELSGPDGEPLGINFHAVTAVVLNALAGPEHAEARIKVAADLMRIDDARDAHA